MELIIYLFFLNWIREENNIELPPMGHYATGICFVDQTHHLETEAMFQDIARQCSLQVPTTRPQTDTIDTP